MFAPPWEHRSFWRSPYDISLIISKFNPASWKQQISAPLHRREQDCLAVPFVWLCLYILSTSIIPSHFHTIQATHYQKGPKVNIHCSEITSFRLAKTMHSLSTVLATVGAMIATIAAQACPPPDIAKCPTPANPSCCAYICNLAHGSICSPSDLSQADNGSVTCSACPTTVTSTCPPSDIATCPTPTNPSCCAYICNLAHGPVCSPSDLSGNDNGSVTCSACPTTPQ